MQLNKIYSFMVRFQQDLQYMKISWRINQVFINI